MSNMKCPFCQRGLTYLAGDIYYCPNHQKYTGSKELWQEFICTHKALDKANNGLKELKDIIACPPDISYETAVSMYADGVLQETTVPEQKD